MGSEDKRPDPKRSFPGGFLIFLVAIVLVILSVQNMSSEKKANVGFSYETEHLVNLDLLQKEESRKTSLNDNLVTFSGKFQDRLSDESKARYRYLELLHDNESLAAQKNRLQGRSSHLNKA